MRKIALLSAITAMALFAFSISTASAPPGYKEPPNPPPWTPHFAIVTDPLITSTGDTSGWITFNCQSQEGFEYSVDVKGLTPGTTYEIRAIPLADVPVPFPPGTLNSTDYGAYPYYVLDTVTTNSEGEGEVEGVHPLGPGFYAYEVQVWNSGTVLTTDPMDWVDFFVFP